MNSGVVKCDPVIIAISHDLNWSAIGRFILLLFIFIQRILNATRNVVAIVFHIFVIKIYFPAIHSFKTYVMSL